MIPEIDKKNVIETKVARCYFVPNLIWLFENDWELHSTDEAAIWVKMISEKFQVKKVKKLL